MMNEKVNRLILYKDDEGKVSVNVRFADEDVWLTQLQLASTYDTTKQNISQHIQGILGDGELDKKSTIKKFLTVQIEGGRKVNRNIDHYNLDMIIALYRKASLWTMSDLSRTAELIYERKLKSTTIRNSTNGYDRTLSF